MSRLTSSRLLAIVASCLLLSLLFSFHLASRAAPADPLKISNYTLANSKRLSSTVYEYEYRAQVTNSGPAVAQVAATLNTPLPTGITVVEGNLQFGDVAAGATVTSTDTFKVRHDRRYVFNADALTWTITFNPVNAAPIAHAGPDQTARVGTTVTLDGGGSTDADGNPLSYRWVLTARPQGSTAALANPTALRPTFIVDRAGDYIAQLIVNDGTLDSAPDTVTVSTENVRPTADAGPDQAIARNALVHLDGSASRDPDGDSLTYRWTLTARPQGSTAVLANPTAVNPTFTADQPGAYTVQLIVNDGAFDSDPDTVTVSTENARPTADAGPDQTVPVGQVVTLDGRTSRDPDGDPLTYRWSLAARPQGSATVLANPSQAQIRFAPDLAGDYAAQLIVNDGALDSTPDTAVITAQPAQTNRTPTITSTPINQATVNQPYRYPLSATDPDVGDTLSYTLITKPNGMTIQATTGLIEWTPTQVGGANVVARVTDQGGLFAEQNFTITVSAATANQAPQVRITTATPSITLPTNHVVLNGTITDDGLPAPPTLTQSWSATGPAPVTFDNASQKDTTALFSVAGTYTLKLTAHDGQLSGSATLTITVNPAGGGGNLPPDPASVAPPVDPTVATTTHAATQFLYTGSNPIQTGVAQGTIDPKRAAVLRGKVLDKQNNPLSGVTITVLNHPEFGQTRSRADGWFDLVVNGGGYLTLNYQKTGYLPAQRQANAPWQDFVVFDDVVLIQTDSQVTAIDLQASTPFQVARGSVVTDSSGTRQATVLFPQGTTATMTLPNGSTQPLNTLQVRATEYTVGANGPQTMPAILPPTSGYTYAVELSVDEAIAANAKTVQFNQPIPFYVDNFLNFPAGTQVPTAYYDFDKVAWVPIDDGRVIKILTIANGIAEVDSTGDGNADNGASLGMTEAERRQLAQLYSAGKTLQRVSVRHFSPHDLNYGIVAQLGALFAKVKQAATDFLRKLDTSCLVGGSIIECENQILGETVPVVGTGLDLNYRSDRVPGRQAAKTLTIPLSDASVPSVLKRIELEITVAGRVIKQSFPAAPNQTHSFTWDGKDAYGRTVQGAQPVSIRIGYVYDGFYALPPAVARTFGATSGQRIPGDIPARQEVTLWESQLARVSVAPDFRKAGVGGWSLDVHHVYEPIGQILYQGDGSRRQAQGLDKIITSVAGTGNTGFSGDGGPALQADLRDPTRIAVASDGSMVIADTGNYRIRQVGPNGIITTIAGTGVRGFSGDGGPAIQAQLFSPQGIAIAADGSVLISDTGNHRIRRIDINGVITTISGLDNFGFSGDGGPAAQASLTSPKGLAITAEGSLLIADSGSARIRRIGPDGTITTVAGGFPRSERFGGDGGPATQATLNNPVDVAVAADGALLIADQNNLRVRRVGTDGIITTIAGADTAGDSGDGGLAIAAKLSDLAGVAADLTGGVLIADWTNSRIRRIGSDGIITTVAGAGRTGGPIGDGGPATKGYIHFPTDMTVAADGGILIADQNNNLIRRVGSPVAGFTGNDIAIASEDGRQLYRFNPEGRHLSTIDTLTKTALYSFGYDSAGRLTSITDADSNVTTIEWDASGNPTAIVAPFGQRTALTVNSDGYLASATNPAGERYQLTTTADGLLTAFTDPKGNTSQFTYDALGRLQRDTNADGGSQNLARTELADGYTVNRSSALNRTTTYTVADLPTGDRQRKARTPDGMETVSVIGTDGSIKVNAPDGSVSETLGGPDPRFGMQSPITTSHKVTTGGLTATSSSTATVNPANPTDPLTFTSLTQTATVNGRSATSTYTAATRRTDSRSPANRQSYSILDAKGRTIETGVTGLESVRMSYDTRGRLASVAQGTGADERITSFSYNAAGYLASTTDALGRSSSLAYDPAGRVQTQTLANGQAIDFAYDANGNLTGLTPPGKPAHGFTYNAINLATAYTPPTVAGSGATGTAYNADKQVTQITRPDGGTLNYGYDSAGRLANLTLPAGQYGYSYNAIGQTNAITAPGGVAMSYGYSGTLLTGVTWSGPVAGSIGYGHDNDFRVQQITVNGSDAIAYQYDADNLLAAAGSLTLARDSQNGLLIGTTLGSTTESYSYNAFGEVTGYTGKHGATNLLTVAYTRDKLGRITEKAETIQGVTTTYNYAYDAIGQLTEVKHNGATAAAYTYDGNGNRLSKTGPGISETGSYDAQDRMLNYAGTTYSYNANGELQSKVQGGQTSSYSYDALGNLRHVTLPNGTQIDYLIDGQNRRIGKKVNNTLTQGFLYQGQLQPAAELDASGNVVSRFVYATGVNVPDYLIKGGQTYRILKDHLGSPRMVVNTSTGAIAQRMDFDEYGKVLADSNPGFQPFGFAGGIYDRDTGLVRFGARDYDADTGRWTAKDQIGFDGEDSNLYAYVGNEPVNLIDPTGSCYTYADLAVDVALFAVGGSCCARSDWGLMLLLVSQKAWAELLLRDWWLA
jgi:RHS repeat-associated protein